MDKKLGLFLVIVIVLGLGVSSWFFIQKIKVPEIKDLKELLPADATSFVEVKDFKQTWEKIKNTEFYSLIEKLKKQALDRAKEMPAKNILDTKIKNFLEGEIVNIFGKVSILAFYKSDLQHLGRIEPKALFITRVAPKTKIEKVILETFLQTEELKNKKELVSNQKHLDLSFKVIDLGDGREIAYLVLRDVLILSNKSGLIKDVIEVLKKQRTSFLEDKRFKLAYEKKSHLDTIFIYFDLKLFLKSFIDSIKQMRQPGYNNFRIDDLTDVFKAYGYPEFDYSILKLDVDKGLHLSYSLVFDTANTSEELKSFWKATKLKDTQTTRLLPQNTILLSLNAVQENAAAYYKYIGESIENLKSIELKERIKKQRQQLEDYFSNLGFKYEDDVLPLFGELGFVFLGLEQITFSTPMPPMGAQPGMNAVTQTMPFPKICAITKVKNKEKAESIILKMIESFEKDMQKKKEDMQKKISKVDIDNNTVIPSLDTTMSSSDLDTNTTLETEETMPAEQPPPLFREEIYSEIKINTLSETIPFIPFLSPSFCFIEDYLVLGLTDTTVKDIVDTFKNRKSSFYSDMNFIDFSSRIPKGITSLFYLDTEKLASEISKIKEQFMMTSRFPASTEFQETVDTIVNILVQLTRIEGYLVSDEEHFDGDVFINIKGL